MSGPDEQVPAEPGTDAPAEQETEPQTGQQTEQETGQPNEEVARETTSPGPRPGGPPEDHTPAHGLDEEPADDLDPAEQAASDELVLAQTALAERTLDLQRLQAEFLNYKRRVERDRELVKENAVYAVLSGLLPVLDDIDRAREHGELEGGFKAVADTLERTVSALGLSKFGAKGDEFDPNVHEALMHGHSPDVTTTTVDVVAHAGYRIGDRVVRAAKVTVLDPEG